jgi:hypothetical protein
MLIPNKFNGYHNGTRQLHISSGGGGGGTTQTTSTVQNTNIPDYARGYVENMLGATQEQLFSGTRGPDVTNPETGEVTQGNFNITGFKPYQAYGGTYDAQGKQLSYDPTKGIAGFTPAQLAAQQNIAGQYDPATGKLALGPDGKPINAGLQMPGGFADASTGLKNLIGAGSAYTAPTNLGYTTRDAVAQGYTASESAAIKAEAARLGISPEAVAAQSTFNPTLQNYQMGGPEKVATRSFTDAGTAESYMNPYTRNVLDIQNRELDRQAGIASNVRGAQAARAGAFGGSRQGIENAEAQRNLMMMKNQNQAQGMQQAYQQAMQQFNAEQGYGLQGQIANQQAGLTVGQQNLGANLGVQQLGTQTAAQIELANLANKQQTGLANQALKGQYGLTEGQFGQQANMQTSAQAQQAALANAAAKSAASQFGAAAANTASLANAAASNQAAQFEAGQKLASAQTAAQYGLGAQNLGLQASSQLGSLANQELAAKQGILSMQNQVGAQQQALDQAAKNQAIQDYANAQQYPLMQLGTMSNMLRGLPMQASTTNQYAASPNPISQAVGTIGSGASIYNALKPGPGGAAGGLPSEFKYAKGGGIMSYDMGGEVEEQLESMDEKGLAAQAKESSSPSIRRMAQRILRERQMGNKPQGTGPMGVQYQAAQPQMPSYAPGGIVAFAQGKTVYGGPSTEADEGEAEARINMQERLAMPPTTAGGIMGATTQPTTQVPVAPQVNRALQQSPDIPAFMKAEYAEAERRKNAPLSEFMAERQAAMREAGVADASEGQQKLRAEMMAEKANLGEEKERQKYLRMAEFFASWGSTPGPVLVAGLNALQKTVPNIVADEREQKKARREIDKSIADLDNATRLEKRGEVDAAMALKLKAAEDMKALNIKFIDYQSRRESDQSSFAATKYNADMQFRSEQLRSQTSALDRAARRDTDKDNKIFGQWQAASKTEADVLGRIQREENDKQHMADLNAVKLGKQTGTDEDNKFDETKVPPAVLSAMKEAQARIAKREESWKQRIKTAAENTDLAYNRIAIKPEVATRDYTRPTGEPQAGASTRPALTDPSLQRQ